MTSKNRPPQNLNSFSQLKTQIYANVAPRFEKAAALHQSNQVLALTTAILLFKLGNRFAVGNMYTFSRRGEQKDSSNNTSLGVPPVFQRPLFASPSPHLGIRASAHSPGLDNRQPGALCRCAPVDLRRRLLDDTGAGFGSRYFSTLSSRNALSLDRRLISCVLALNSRPSDGRVLQALRFVLSERRRGRAQGVFSDPLADGGSAPNPAQGCFRG